MKSLFKILIVCAILLGCTEGYSQEYAKNPVKKSKGAPAPVKKVEQAKPVDKKPESVNEVPVGDDEFIRLMKLGGSYAGKGKYTDAVATFNKALEFNRETGWVMRCRASAYFGKRDYENAIIDYTAAINAGSDYLGEVYYSRGMSKVRLAVPDNAGACADLKKARELGFVVDNFDIDKFCEGIN